MHHSRVFRIKPKFLIGIVGFAVFITALWTSRNVFTTGSSARSEESETTATVAENIIQKQEPIQKTENPTSDLLDENVSQVAIDPDQKADSATSPQPSPEKSSMIPTAEASTTGRHYYVSPSGNDGSAGTSSTSPWKSIQKAVDQAQSGETIHLADGVYLQDIVSRRNGTSDKPITITGTDKAIIKGGGNGRVIEINHDYLALEGFTVDGLAGSGKKETDYRDKLIYVLGKEKLAGVTGLKLRRLVVRNAGGECIRLRYFAIKNEIANNIIKNCGVHDFRFKAGGKNGEGVYIGTAPEQRQDGKNPTTDPDRSDENWIHDNVFDTQGNECVDIKESASGNIVENNKCTGQKDPESAGFDSRGNGNIFRNNDVYACEGAGVRLGGDTGSDGIKNLIYSNTIRDNRSGGVKLMQSPQTKLCGNTFTGNAKGDFVGKYGKNTTNQACSS